ncbi:MAG: transposase [Fibrobacteres bacterium]|nr:transposase [Fibrobacterota bacterium]
MARKRHTEEQIIKVLKAAEHGGKIIELCRSHGITEQTFFRWRSKYGGMEVSDVAKMRQLESENNKLKRLLADRDLEIDAMKDILSKKW